MKQITVDIYTITTVDNTAVETLLHSAVSGVIERNKDVISFIVVKESAERSAKTKEYLFTPDILLSDAASGQYLRSTDDETFLIVDVEDFESHNEILCREVKT